MEPKSITTEVRDDKVAILRLNKPEKMNAISFEMFKDF
jgi:enoyl-CoA hydratase/carnithine racemase